MLKRVAPGKGRGEGSTKVCETDVKKFVSLPLTRWVRGPQKC